MGARQYDTTLGRFISLDPVLENDPQQLNGYTYADSNPITHSDPSGLMYDGSGGTANCGWGCGDGAPVPTTPPPSCGQFTSCSATFYDPSTGNYNTYTSNFGSDGSNHGSITVTSYDPLSALTAQAAAADRFRREIRAALAAQAAARNCGANRACGEDPGRHENIAFAASLESTAQKLYDFLRVAEFASALALTIPVAAACIEAAVVSAGCVGAVSRVLGAMSSWFSGDGVPGEAEIANGISYGALQGVGQDLKRSATVGSDEWQFNTGHGFDRVHSGPGGMKTDLRTTGLTPNEIEQGIVDDVYGYMANGGAVPRVGSPGFSGPLDRQIQIGGYSVGYRLVQTPDSVYRVATYWLNP